MNLRVLFALEIEAPVQREVCTICRPPTAFAKHSAGQVNAIRQAGTVFLLIDSGSAVTACPRDCFGHVPLESTPTIRMNAAGGNQALEHLGEKTVQFTTSCGSDVSLNFQVCSVRFRSFRFTA